MTHPQVLWNVISTAFIRTWFFLCWVNPQLNISWTEMTHTMQLGPTRLVLLGNFEHDTCCRVSYIRFILIVLSTFIANFNCNLHPCSKSNHANWYKPWLELAPKSPKAYIQVFKPTFNWCGIKDRNMNLCMFCVITLFSVLDFVNFQ